MSPIMMMLAVILLVLQYASAIPFINDKNVACDPLHKELTKYTGYRVQRQFQYSVGTHTVGHKMVVTQCSMGEAVDERVVDLAGSAVDLAWNQSVCSTHDCLRLARRAPYVIRDLSLYVPGTVVGGAFTCTQIQNQTFCQGAMPLLADNPLGQWTQVHGPQGAAVVNRIPLLKTPDIMDRKYTKTQQWSQRVDPFERYPGYKYPEVYNSMAKAFFQLVGGGKKSGYDVSKLSRVLAGYSPARLTQAMRYLQALLDQW